MKLVDDDGTAIELKSVKVMETNPGDILCIETGATQLSDDALARIQVVAEAMLKGTGIRCMIVDGAGKISIVREIDPPEEADQEEWLQDA